MGAASLLFVGACIAPEGAGEPRTTVLEARVYIQADYDVVWDCFTRAERYAAWYSAPCLEFGSAPGEAVRWGTSFGMCLGYCVEHLEVTPTQVRLTVGSRDSIANPPQTFERPTTPAEWQSLVSALEPASFEALDETVMAAVFAAEAKAQLERMPCRRSLELE